MRLKRLHEILWIIAALGSIFFIPRYCLAEESLPWISGQPVSSSIIYQYYIEQRSGFHQQIHRVRVDLLGKDLSVEMIPAENFPHQTEYPSDIMKRRNAHVVVPACLFQRSEEGRCQPVGSLGFSGSIYTLEQDVPEIELHSLNHLFFRRDGGSSSDPLYIKRENGEVIPLSGLNQPAQNPGLYLYSKPFDPIPKEEMEKWNVGRCYLLEQTSNSSDPSLYWVRKVIEGPRPVDLSAREVLIIETRGETGQKDGMFQYREQVHVVIPGEPSPGTLQGVFCGGPYFLHEGRYDELAVQEFSRKKGAPPLSHYTELRARLALSLDPPGRYLEVYAVDQKGFSRQGLSLAEFAEFLSKNGVREAVCLPDGETAALVLPEGRVNSTSSGLEAPVLCALCISERPPSPGETVNILTRFPNTIIACGGESLNPVSSLNDGSYSPSPTLDNYWEHNTEDAFHKHGMLIDLLKPYEMRGLEFFHASQLGFSPHYNIRGLSLYGDESSKSSLRKVCDVDNSQGLSHQYIPFSPGIRIRYLKIDIEKPNAFPNNNTVRLAELALWGKAE